MEESTQEVLNLQALLGNPTFWVAASFVIFFALFGKTLWRALSRALDGRSARIKAELDEARRLREEAEAVLTVYRKKYAESMKEAEAILAKARADADSMVANAEAELKHMLETRRRTAEAKIAQAEKQAVAEVQSHVADITIAAARALIVETLSQASQTELVRHAVADIARKVH